MLLEHLEWHTPRHRPIVPFNLHISSNFPLPLPQVIRRELPGATILEVAHRQATIASCGRGGRQGSAGA